MKRIGLLAILLVFLGCKSSSSVVATPNANIAGTYPTAVVTNADLATFTNCTGDFISAEGLTVTDLLVDPPCVTNDPFVITQNGNTWQTGSQFATCPTFTYVASAAGIVSGDRIDGTISLDASNGILETQTITNGAAGTGGTIVFRIVRISVSGAASGSCSLVPPIEYVLSQTRSGHFSAVGLLGKWK